MWCGLWKKGLESCVDIAIVSSVICVTMSIANITLFWVFNFILSECKTNYEEVPENT